MSTNATNEASLKAIRAKIESTLRLIDHRIASLQENSVKDYLRFFEIDAERMYQEQSRRLFYLDLADRMNSGIKKDPVEWLLNVARRKANEIARGQLSRNSTNPMSNHAYLLRLQVEQGLITELEGLAYIAECAAKS